MGCKDSLKCLSLRTDTCHIHSRNLIKPNIMLLRSTAPEHLFIFISEFLLILDLCGNTASELQLGDGGARKQVWPEALVSQDLHRA